VLLLLLARVQALGDLAQLPGVAVQLVFHDQRPQRQRIPDGFIDTG